MTEQAFHKVAASGAAADDYYGLLELPERFAIDADELERRYLALSRQVHPDRFVGASAAERVQALQRSMTLNQAYQTLRKPVPRAEYLLARRGVSIGDNETLDPAFLMDVLEMREELAEAKAAGDRDALARLEAAMTARRDEEIEAVATLFADHDAGGDAALLDQIKRRLIALRYIRRYLEAFDDLDDLDADEEST